MKNKFAPSRRKVKIAVFFLHNFDVYTQISTILPLLGPNLDQAAFLIDDFKQKNRQLLFRNYRRN